MDIRQRYFLENTPVRGECVQLTQSYQHILGLRTYPLGVQLLLGEMLAAICLLASTLKIQGRVSLQAQGSGALKWAMAECTDQGEVRGLAHLADDCQVDTVAEAFDLISGGVLFVNIEPTQGSRYQGIIALDQPNLSACLASYFDYSAQIPTLMSLTSNTTTAAGLLMQLLPMTDDERQSLDTDLWPRLQALMMTLKPTELTSLEPQEVIYRLFHEETVIAPAPDSMAFGCTCSSERCSEALMQVPREELLAIVHSEGAVNMDCQFCNSIYRYALADIELLLADD
jgi:molecular chaperone Hsp33